MFTLSVRYKLIFLSSYEIEKFNATILIVLTLAFTSATICCHIAIIITHTFIVSYCVVTNYIGLLETAMSRRICTLVDI